MTRSWKAIPAIAILSWLMKFILIGMLPYLLFKGNYLFALATLVAFFLSLAPSIVNRNSEIHLPIEIDLLITLSIFLHTFFGELLEFYNKIWIWDKVLHLYSSAVIAMLAFMIVYNLHYTRKLSLSLPFIGLFTIVFALAVGSLWEMGEFTVDKLLGLNTQKGLNNTMWDLINDLIGGAIAAFLCVIYVKYAKPEKRKRLTKPIGEVFNPERRKKPRYE